MITSEQLREVNGRLPKIDLKEKPYVMVNKRVQGFRDICPEGTITTEILSHENGVVIMRATITDENGKVLATGLSREKDGDGFINKTSYIENAETSAVGRALGFLGIGIDYSMASAEEVANAIIQNEKPEEPKLIDLSKVETIKEDIEKGHIKETDILKYYKIARLEDMNDKQFSEYAAQKQKRDAARNKEVEE